MTAAEDAINNAMRTWRQGDCVTGEHWFIMVVDPERPLTEEAKGTGERLVEVPVDGLCIVSQTCDIVRDCKVRPYLEVSALLPADEEDLRLARSLATPRVACVPGVASRGLIVDLNRTMTIEKSVAASWERVPGCTNDDEARSFAKALARKRERFAFPDDFVHMSRRLQDWVRKKHDKRSSDGEALQTIAQIRVNAAPSWDAESVALMFYFILAEGTPATDMTPHLAQWLTKMNPAGRYVKVDGAVVGLGDMTAREFVGSDVLDLDYLTERGRSVDT